MMLSRFSPEYAGRVCFVGYLFLGLYTHTYIPHRLVEQPPMACVSHKLGKVRSETSLVKPCFRRPPFDARLSGDKIEEYERLEY